MPTPLTPEQPPLSLHAEYLPNIRQVTLYVTLPTTQDADSKTSPTISLSESRRAVTVFIPDHTAEDEVSETIKLPARVHQASRRVLEGANTTGSRDGKPQGNTGNGNENGISHNDNNGKGRELSFRMQIDPEDALSSTASGADEDVISDSYVPWMAGDMDPSTKVRCRACGRLVLDDPASSSAGPGTDTGDGFSESRTSSGWTWKDLPSGNWAEMMDFWHCHKPDTHDHEKDPEGKTVSIQERNSQVKGYGAANQVVARPGTVLVDVASFLVVKGDCEGVKATTNSPGTTQSPITCATCDSLLGVEDPIANGYRLFKATLSASMSTSIQAQDSTQEQPIWTTLAPETVVSAQLLELIERESARRFGVHCGGESGLLIWVFNPSLHTSTISGTHRIAPHRAMKVLFQEVPDIAAILNPDSGKLSSLSLEELELPAGIFSALREALEGSNGMLPRSARWFREWRVGVLGRFERGAR